MNVRSDAEILALLRSTRPEGVVADEIAGQFAAEHPAASMMTPDDLPDTGTGNRAALRRQPRVFVVVAAAAVVVVAVVGAVLVLRTTPGATTLVPASQPPGVPAVTTAPVPSMVSDDGAVVAPSVLPSGSGAAGGDEHSAGNGADAAPAPAPAPPTSILGPTAPGDGAVPPAAAPEAGVDHSAVSVRARSPLPYCGTIFADAASQMSPPEVVMAQCFWALVDRDVPAEVIWTGIDSEGSAFTLIVRHVGGRRSETYKEYGRGSGEPTWALQRCTNLSVGADLLSVDRTRTVCGADVPI